MAPVSLTSHCPGEKDVNLRLLRNGVVMKRLELLLHHNRSGWANSRAFREEIRSLEFWRAVIAECLASFFYIIFTCGCYVLDASEPPKAFHVALSSGSAMATLVLCFGPISGAHVNPAVSIALSVTRRISLLRMFFYVTAQCGGAIAGTALLYGMTMPGYNGNLANPAVLLKLSPWQGFGVEALLSFIIVMTVFATLDPYQSPVFNYPSPLIGIAYLSCSLTGMSSTGAALNPARALGPAFVMNRWDLHWIYWGGPLSGAILAGLIYEYVFDSRRSVSGFQEALDDLNHDCSLPSNDDECCEPTESANQLSSPPYTAPNNVYHSQPRYDDYSSSSSRQRGGYLPSQALSNYAQFPPPPPPPPLLRSDYRAVDNTGYGESTADSLYDSAAAFRPHSSASRNYSSVYGSRSGGGGGVKPPHRMECGGPGSTKF